MKNSVRSGQARSEQVVFCIRPAEVATWAIKHAVGSFWAVEAGRASQAGSIRSRLSIRVVFAANAWVLSGVGGAGWAVVSWFAFDHLVGCCISASTFRTCKSYGACLTFGESFRDVVVVVGTSWAWELLFEFGSKRANVARTSNTCIGCVSSSQSELWTEFSFKAFLAVFISILGTCCRSLATSWTLLNSANASNAEITSSTSRASPTSWVIAILTGV